MKTAIPIYPGVTQLDFAGPAQFLSLVPNMSIDILWFDTQPVMTDSGFSIQPTMAFENAPRYDVLILPGGPGQNAILQDETYLEFIRKHAAQARYVVGICTGSITLGKAGLLNGIRANSHWAFREQLAIFGAEPVDERVVMDGKFITGGGVSAGMDIALFLISKLTDSNMARLIQLLVEYEPDPPFRAGRPELAGPELTAAARGIIEKIPFLEEIGKS